MNDDHYYSIDDPLTARRDVLQAHLWTLELQKKQDVLDAIDAKKNTQFKKLENQISSIKRNLQQLQKTLPEVPEQVIVQQKAQKKQTRKEIFPTTPQEPDMTELEREILELKKKIDTL